LVKLTVLPALATACATAPIREDDDDSRINQAIRSELEANPSPAVVQDPVAYIDEDGPCPPDDEDCLEVYDSGPGIGADVYVGGSGEVCLPHKHHYHVQRGGFGGFFSSHPSGGFAHGGFHSGFHGFSAGAHASMGG
jgi:hypothetical protein